MRREGRRAAAATLLTIFVGVGLWLWFRADLTADAPPEAADRDAAPNPPPPQLAVLPSARPRTGEAAVESAKPVSPNSSRLAGIEGNVVSLDTGRPVPRARFTLTFRTTDGRRGVAHADFETDLDGRFRGGVATDDPLTIDYGSFADAGLRLQAWSAEGGTTGEAVLAGKGETARWTLQVTEMIALEGVVVDEAGRPVAQATYKWNVPGTNGGQIWEGHIGTASEAGAFTISGVLARPESVLQGSTAKSAGEVLFEKTGYVSRRIPARDVLESERRAWRVVLTQGRRISGHLVDERGAGLQGIQVEADYGDPSARRVAQTGERGAFLLDHLAEGACTLGAAVVDLDAEAKLETTITSDLDDVTLVARPVDLSHPLHPVYVAGLRLVDVDDELRKSKGLPEGVKVMVLDAGRNAARLIAMGGLRSGQGIWHIGDRPVTSVKDLLDRVLSEHESAAARNPGFATFRIVYTYPAPPIGPGGTMTTLMSLTDADFNAIRRARAALR